MSASPKKVKVAKKAASHPTYQQMVKMAIQTLKEPKGSSKAAILKYILKNYKVGDNVKQVNFHFFIFAAIESIDMYISIRVTCSRVCVRFL